MNLKQLPKNLPNGNFLRIHRSYIANLHRIDRVTHRIVYCGKYEITVERVYYRELIEKIHHIKKSEYYENR